MRKSRCILGFVLLTLLSVMPGVVIAKEPTQNADLPDLYGPVNEWSETDLEQWVNWVVEERSTVSEAQAVWKKASVEQREKIGELLALKAGVPLDEWQKFVESNSTSGRAALQTLVPHGFPGEIWRQHIENTWTVGHPPGSTFASSYWNSPNCDDDPSDPDWAFKFDKSYEWYSRDPDSLRWTSESAQVYLAFMAAYGGDLSGYSFSWNEARLCIGTTGVRAAGGTSKVKNNVFLSPGH